MKILAMDQALRASGWCILEDDKPQKWGVINPQPKSADVQLALVSIRRQFREIFRSNKPDIIVFEVPKGADETTAENHNTAFVLAQVYGVLTELAAEENIPIDNTYAATWQADCGIHKRDRISRKQGAVDFIKKRYNITAPQDSVDAMCIGYSWWLRNKPEVSAF